MLTARIYKYDVQQLVIITFHLTTTFTHLQATETAALRYRQYSSLLRCFQHFPDFVYPIAFDRDHLLSELPPAIEQAASNECLHIHQNFLFVFRYT